MVQGSKTKSRLPIAAMVLALPLGACMAATTYGTGVSPGKQTVEDLASIVSFGGKKGAPIDYAARPPIVAPPPGAALPAPGQSTATAANWPKDESAASITGSLDRGDPSTQAYDPKKTVKGVGLAPILQQKVDPMIEMQQMQKASNQKIFAAAKAGQIMGVDANGNPVRKTLSEPPVDYRVPDPEAPEAFEAAKNKKWWQN
jgi:hypothetical protein